MKKTPVLLVAFNRYDTAIQVFEKIRKYQPTQFFFACDGPRKEKGDAEVNKINQVRSLVDKVDWDCEIKTLFRDVNVGCGLGVSGAITWFFEHVERGIILEDDCVPDVSFFSYCTELLNKYEHDDKITHVNGNNFACRKFVKSDADYHFIYYPQVWGWATWRRAWNKYKYRISSESIPNLKEGYFHLNWSEKDIKNQIRKWINSGGKIDTWDYQWQAINLIERNLAIIPKKNLIKNLGFTKDSTHSGQQGVGFVRKTLKSDLEIAKIGSPLVHPKEVTVDRFANDWFKQLMISASLKTKLIALLAFLRR